MACDAPSLLYSLISFGEENDPQVQLAAQKLIEYCQKNGWRCLAAQELGSFKGPGPREDPCPMATLLALKVLSILPGQLSGEAAKRGVEMLLGHWEIQSEKKYFLFGIGKDFRKIKYPYVWYNLLHVMEVLSRFPFAVKDPRLIEMYRELIENQDQDGCLKATSMYRSWSKWSFADKKESSPWLTFLMLRIAQRVEVKEY